MCLKNMGGWVKSLFHDFCSILSKNKLPFFEFIFVWMSSLSPILFGVLVYKMNTPNVDFIETSYTFFMNTPLFSFVSTMVSPFIYLTMLQISSKDKRRVISWGWLFLILSIVILLISAIDVASLIPGESSVMKSDFKSDVMIVNYILALIVLYYSIYLNSIEPPNIEEKGRERVATLMGDADDVLGAQS